MTEASSKPDLGAVVAAIGLAIGLATAWLYLVGWTYAYWYFDHFQLGLLTLDISRDTFLVYGFWVLIEQWLWLFGLFLLTLIVTIWRPWRRIDWPRTVIVWLGLLGGLAPFLLGYAGARLTATTHFAEDQATGYSAARRIEITVEQSWLEKRSTADLAGSLVGGCFRLLLSNSEKLFLIRPVKQFEKTDQPLLMIPWSEVRAVRILTDSDSCS